MRVVLIAVGKDYGSAFQPNMPTPDGSWPIGQWTRIEVREHSEKRWLYIDAAPIGEIIAVVIDHEDEKAPPVQPQRGT